MACRSTGRWRTCLATPCSSLRTARGNGESLNIHLSLRPNFLLVWQVRSETRVRFGQEPRDGILTRCSVESQRFFKTKQCEWTSFELVSRSENDFTRKVRRWSKRRAHPLWIFIPSQLYVWNFSDSLLPLGKCSQPTSASSGPVLTENTRVHSLV